MVGVFVGVVTEGMKLLLLAENHFTTRVNRQSGHLDTAINAFCQSA